MAELVAGVGDEVLMFIAFIFLSLVMVAIIARRNQGRQGQRQRREEQTPAANAPPTNVEPAESEVPEHSLGRQDSSSGVTPAPDEGQVRSRFRGSGPSREQSGPSREQSGPSREQSGPSREQSGPSREQSGLSREQSDTDGSSHLPSSPAEGELALRLVLSHNTMTVYERPSSSLGEIRRAYFQEELVQNCPVRFIYRGQVLDSDTQTLEDLGIRENAALHVHIGQPRLPEQDRDQQEEVVFDIAWLFLPLFGLILAIVWVLLLSFPDMFSFITKVLLFVLSLGYVFLTYNSVCA